MSQAEVNTALLNALARKDDLLEQLENAKKEIMQLRNILTGIGLAERAAAEAAAKEEEQPEE